MIFFYAPNACSFASHLALEHVGASMKPIVWIFPKTSSVMMNIWQ